jgi:hypothetical protein
METQTFHFNPKSHTYTLGETELPGVTTILREEGLYVPNQYAKKYMERGRVIHSLTEQLDNGNLDEDFVEDEYKPYINAYKTFLSASGVKYEKIEYPAYHKKYLYAGTIDRVGLWDKKRFILDIKGTIPKQKCKFQLREVLSTKEIDYYWATFLAALHLNRFKKGHGLG